MKKPLGRGLLQSLRGRVVADVKELVRDNKSLRNARYGLFRRILRMPLFARPAVAFPILYAFSLAVLTSVEWGIRTLAPGRLSVNANADFAKDAAGFFLSAQIGILALLTVAISVVTLLTQKDDGSAFNTDVRLYYVESHSYKLAISGVLLSIVIIIQLFSPLQYLFLFLSDPRYLSYFTFWITVIHAAWLILNFGLFFHFLNTTLRFVEPKSRAELRRQYIANEIVPQDVTRRLLNAYYLNISTYIFSDEERKEGPLISFGMGTISNKESVTEIAHSFRSTSRLSDVWLLPLSFSLRRWLRRSVDFSHSHSKSKYNHWPGHLAVLASFTQTHESYSEILVREGAVPLSRIERFLIGASLRFTRIDPREESLPTPTNFIEQLVYKVVSQIDAGLPNGFDAALDEAVDFHSFLLSSQNARDEGGRFVNLAQVNDGPFRQPDYEWLREYRRAYTAAINKMTADGWFIRGMNRLVVQLWPRDPEEYPSGILRNVLDLGRHEIALFEDWITKRAVVVPPEAGAAPDLAGSDLRAYEDALIHFVASWESLEQIIIITYKLRHSNKNDDQFWHAAAAGWPALHAHLSNTAYFLVAAVWNEDLIGSARFRDLEVRWIQAFHGQVEALYPFRDGFMLTPDIFKAQWPDAHAAAVRTLTYPQPGLTAETVFGLVLRESYRDVVAITGIVLLHWFATKQQPSVTTVTTAIHLLRFETLQDSGNTLLDSGSVAKTIFRLIFDLLVRESLYSRFDEERYSATLEGLIRVLNEMATPRMIPGRIYSGFALEGFRTLTPEFLAILAGNLPPSGDAGVSDFVRRLIQDYPEFQADRALRDFEYQFGRYAAALDGELDQRFTAVVERFVANPDFGTLRNRLKMIFTEVVSLIVRDRLRRIQEAPLDETRLATVREAVQSALLGNRQSIGPFSPGSIGRTDRAIQAHETTFREIDRGAFTRPEMSGLTFSELPHVFVEFATNYLRNIFWHELYRRPKIVEKFTPSSGIRALLNRAQELVESIEFGDDVIFLVPYDSFAHAVSMTASGFPTDGLETWEVSRIPDKKSGNGSTYAGTVAGIHIYGWQMTDAGLLASSDILKSVRFACVNDLDTIFDFQLFDFGDPTKSHVRMWLAPEFDWEDRKFVEFQFSGLAHDSEIEGTSDA